MVVITDGQENSSCEFTKSQNSKMIEDKTLGQQWQFVFLSADLDAIHDAVSTGVHADAVLLFAKNSRGNGGSLGLPVHEYIRLSCSPQKDDRIQAR